MDKIKEMKHIGDIMKFMKEENHKLADSSIYEDIKSRSKLPSLVCDPQIRP